MATPNESGEGVQAECDAVEVEKSGFPGADQALPMVGLGASAGGFPALRHFFEAMPADSGIVFVVVMHLAAEHESSLASVLQRSTAMRVVQAEQAQVVQANHVYVIPPGKYLSAVDGRLQLAEFQSQ